ncbi:hypothetical protein Salat_0992600 [Sesamum alatum]|uniref:Uncharacterized protein n=1 Tax=Sesamum alatum TaxID=300844 RepID=A0AAE2CRY3_9LAMI|nr:hypothetical protein Salat_0992600 [Sesamum alatum]
MHYDIQIQAELDGPPHTDTSAFAPPFHPMHPARMGPANPPATPNPSQNSASRPQTTLSAGGRGGAGALEESARGVWSYSVYSSAVVRNFEPSQAQGNMKGCTPPPPHPTPCFYRLPPAPS